jgi:prepilin signal peptidase PulO-like enzyme (type II secretory pathway)
MNNEFEFDSLIKKMAADHQPELPSPGVIWWRAQILKKQAEKERIELPFTIMRALVAVLCVVVVVGLWISQAEGISAIFNHTNGFPFAPLLVVGAVIGIGCVGLIWWKASEA